MNPVPFLSFCPPSFCLPSGDSYSIASRLLCPVQWLMVANVPAQARRANDVRLPKARPRRCLQPAGWAFVSLCQAGWAAIF